MGGYTAWGVESSFFPKERDLSHPLVSSESAEVLRIPLVPVHVSGEFLSFLSESTQLHNCYLKGKSNLNPPEETLVVALFDGGN